jgi:SAM-dependent methyltransferase
VEADSPAAGARLEKRDLERLFTASFAGLTAGGLGLPEDIWNEEFFRANELINLYTDFQVWTVLDRLGLERGGLEGGRFPPSRRDSIDWLLAKASGSALVGKGAPPAGYGLRLRQVILDEHAALAPCLDLVDLAASGFPAFLREESDGRSILFAPATHALWERYFDQKNPFYQPVNRLAASAAAEAVPGGALQVLEVGAGCGSGTITLLEELGDHPLRRYTATDISPGFLRKARSRVEEWGTPEGIELEYRLLDLNRPRESWRLADGGFDLVFAVNVLHCARDLVGALSALRRLLAPGGVLVLGEGLRPARGRPVHPEFIFQLLDEFREVAVHPVHRPSWGFLDGAGWLESLARAGFGEIKAVPDPGRLARSYPEHTIAAIVAR